MMRGLAAGLAAIMVACVVWSTDAAASEGGQASAAVGEAEGPSTYRAIPRRIRRSMYLNFDANGKVQRRNAHMSAQFVVVPRTASELIAYRYKDTEVMVSTNVREKVTRVHPDVWTPVQRHGNRIASQQLSLNITSDVPPRSATSLRRVAGELHVMTGEKPVERIEFGPYAEITGKERSVPGMKKARLEVDRDNKRTRIVMKGKGWASLVKLEFVDADGEVVFTVDGRTGVYAARDRYSRAYNFALPENGKAIIHKWSEVKIRKHRFEARDVPLPASFSDEAVELSDAAPDARGTGAWLTPPGPRDG